MQKSKIRRSSGDWEGGRLREMRLEESQKQAEQQGDELFSLSIHLSAHLFSNSVTEGQAPLPHSAL